MGQGYTRNDTTNNIANGNVISAADLDGEFDAIVASFNETTGHTHDGTAAEGGAVSVIGPVQEYLADGTAFYPKTTAVYTLGKASNVWANLHLVTLTLSGTATMATVDINGGNIDGTTIGAATPAAGTFTTAYADLYRAPIGSNTAPIYSFATDTDTGMYRVGVNTIAFSAGGTATAQIDTNGLNGAIGGTTPAAGTFTSLNSANATFTNGGGSSVTTSFASAVVGANFNVSYTTTGPLAIVVASDGGVLISDLTSTTADINGGTIDGTTIGAASPAAGSFTSAKVADGTLALPSIAFTADPDTGFYRVTNGRFDAVNNGVSTVVFGTGSTTVANLTATTADINAGTIDATTIGGTTPAAADFTNVGFTGVMDAANGTAAATAYGFTGQPATGMYRESATGYLNFSLGGTEQLSLETTFARFNGTVQTPAGVIAGTTIRTGDGTAGAPGFTFAGDTDIGMFTSGANTLDFATSGISRISIGAGGQTTIDNLASPLVNIDGGNIDGTVIGNASATTARFEASSSFALLGNRTTAIGNVAIWQYNTTQVGSISVTASATTYNTTSDYRTKENITPVQGPVELIRALNPITYTAIADGQWYDGFLAHEVQGIIPTAVTGELDGTKEEEYEVTPAVEATFDTEGVELTPAEPAVMGTRIVPDMQSMDYGRLTPILTAALQEALNKIEVLEAQNVAFEARLSALEV